MRIKEVKDRSVNIKGGYTRESRDESHYVKSSSSSNFYNV